VTLIGPQAQVLFGHNLCGCNRRMEVMSLTVRKRGGSWHFDFQIRGVRYREAIPEARTKFQAEQAETKARDQVFQGTYGTSQLGNQDLAEFVSETYLPWAKANKRTWRNDEIIANQWAEIFRGKALREVSPLAIEKWKRDRAQSITRRGTTRSPASVTWSLLYCLESSPLRWSWNRHQILVANFGSCEWTINGTATCRSMRKRD
jgi:hypothetical protein